MLINYNEFLEVLKKYEEFDEKDLINLYEKYGQKTIVAFFDIHLDNLNEEEKKSFMEKYLVYFERRNSEIDNYLTLRNEIVPRGKIVYDVLSDYPVMSQEEESEQGLILNDCKSKLTIIKEEKDFELYPRLNLEKILLSVKNQEDLMHIKLICDISYLLKDDNIFKEEKVYLKKFIELSTNKILTKEELKQTFSNLNFDNTYEIEDLNYQVKYLKDYIFAKFNFFVRNFRLVSIVAKSVGFKLNYEERLQEGFLGLIKGINRYDISKGVRFSTYATYWINQNIQRAQVETGNIIKKPRTLFEKIKKYENFVYKYKSVYGIEPTMQECAEGLNISLSKALELDCYSKNVLSLDDGPLIKRLGKVDFVSEVADKSINFEEETVNKDYIKSIMKEIDNLLSEREKEILFLKTGYNSENRVYTFEEIAKIRNLSRQRIQEIQKRTIKKLVKVLREKDV